MGTPVGFGYAVRSAILLMSVRPMEKMVVRCPLFPPGLYGSASSLRPGSRPGTTGQRKTVRRQRSYEVSTATFRSERRHSKPYDPVGTVNIARWQSGSEQRLTARKDGCAAGSLPSVTSRTEHRPIVTATRRRATPHRPMRERSGSSPQPTTRAEKVGAMQR